MRTCDVAVTGGGIGGLTLAASLSQHPLSVQVFEQDTELREIGAGVAIGGNATRLLSRLGVDLEPAANIRRLWNSAAGQTEASSGPIR